jgi:hypothetical protein
LAGHGKGVPPAQQESSDTSHLCEMPTEHSTILRRTWKTTLERPFQNSNHIRPTNPGKKGKFVSVLN